MVSTADKTTQCDLSKKSTQQDNNQIPSIQLYNSSDEYSDTSDASSYSPEADMYQSNDDQDSTSEDDEWYICMNISRAADSGGGEKGHYPPTHTHTKLGS